MAASSPSTAADSHGPPQGGEEATVTVLLFASVREVMGGLSQLEVPVPTVGCDTARFRALLAALHPALRPFLLEEGDSAAITLALNEEYVPHGTVWPVRPGDTIALIPPISGG